MLARFTAHVESTPDTTEALIILESFSEIAHESTADPDRCFACALANLPPMVRR